MTFDFVTFPPGVDKARAIMPKRPATDRHIYGIDEAWLAEGVQVRRFLNFGHSQGVYNLPERPTAGGFNTVRRLINRFDAVDVGSVTMASALPSAIGDYTGYTFDPADVAKGKPIRRAHMAEMFDAMAARGRYVAGAAETISGELLFDYISHHTSKNGTPEDTPGYGAYIFGHYWQAQGSDLSDSWQEAVYQNIQTRTTPTFNMGAVKAAWFSSLAAIFRFDVEMHWNKFQIDGGTQTTIETADVEETRYSSLPVTVAQDGAATIDYSALIGMASAAITAAGAADRQRDIPASNIGEYFTLYVKAHDPTYFVYTMADEYMP